MSDLRDQLFNRIFDAVRGQDINQATLCFNAKKAEVPALKGEIIQSFAQYWLAKSAEENAAERGRPGTPAESLLAAVRAWNPDPMSTSPDAFSTAILNYLRTQKFAPVFLGKYRGQYLCKLQPMIALAPDTERFDPGLEYSISNRKLVRAIKYAESQASEEENQFVDCGPDGKKSTEIARLRRIFDFEFVHMNIDEVWIKTRHALVLDVFH